MSRRAIFRGRAAHTDAGRWIADAGVCRSLVAIGVGDALGEADAYPSGTAFGLCAILVEEAVDALPWKRVTPSRVWAVIIARARARVAGVWLASVYRFLRSDQQHC